MKNKMFNDINTKKSQKNSRRIELINLINNKLKDMENSQFRTTNFSIIQFFSQNNFKPLNQEEVIKRLLEDYKNNPTKYVLSNEKSNFKNISTFKSSILGSISKNKAFIKDSKNGIISLDLEKTEQYLKAVYRQYTSNSKDVITPQKINANNRFTQKKRSNGMKSTLNFINNIEDKENQLEKENYKSRRTGIKTFQNFEFNGELNSFSIYCDQTNKNNFPKNINDNNKMMNFNFKKNKNSNDLTKIFFEKLLYNANIDSINNDGISFLIKELESYALNIKEKKIKNVNENIKKEIKQLIKYLKNFSGKKKYYDLFHSKIYKFQKELFLYFQMMENLKKIIELETYHIMNYDHETYMNYNELFLKRNELYENILEKIRIKLDEIGRIKLELIENKNSIQSSINNITNINNFNERKFKEIKGFIEKELKLDYSSNQLELEEEECNDNLSPDEIITSFVNAKKNIIDKVNNIYNTISNVTVP